MSKLFETAIVSKRNVLNEIRSNNMTLQELRLFSVYLSKINPNDKSTRVVRFQLDDFRKLMGIGIDMNVPHFRTAIRRILQQIVEVPNENGSGYRAFQLFKEAVVEKDDNDEWYVELDAHDKALPLMFDFKTKYFKYELWNALRLKSPNQIRMYEILKQYEKLGKREISVTQLRELLGIDEKEYTYWQNFKIRVLDSCQQALKENTDICYTYERGKAGRGGKWLSIVFHISKNKAYKDPLALDEFIKPEPEQDVVEVVLTAPQLDNQTEDEEEPMEIDYGSDLANLLGEAACKNEFSPEQIRIIQDLVIKAVPVGSPLECCDYLIHQMHTLNYYASQKKIKNRFAYLKNILENEIKE